MWWLRANLIAQRLNLSLHPRGEQSVACSSLEASRGLMQRLRTTTGLRDSLIGSSSGIPMVAVPLDSAQNSLLVSLSGAQTSCCGSPIR